VVCDTFESQVVPRSAISRVVVETLESP